MVVDFAWVSGRLLVQVVCRLQKYDTRAVMRCAGLVGTQKPLLHHQRLRTFHQFFYILSNRNWLNDDKYIPEWSQTWRWICSQLTDSTPMSENVLIILKLYHWTIAMLDLINHGNRRNLNCQSDSPAGPSYPRFEDHLFVQLQIVFGRQLALLCNLSQHVVNEPLLLIAVTARSSTKALRWRLQHWVSALFHL